MSPQGRTFRLAWPRPIGVARVGGLGEDSTGDIFLAFATGNRDLARTRAVGEPIPLRMLLHEAMTPLFEAVADDTEEAILNALCAATTTAGINGHPLDRLREVMSNDRRTKR
jgi:D-aminopeptidase